MYFSILGALTITNCCFFGCWCCCCKIAATNIEVIDNNDEKILSSLALLALPHHGNGTVLMPKQLPPSPLPPSHVSTLLFSAEEVRER
jgi:hypothetical protein